MKETENIPVDSYFNADQVANLLQCSKSTVWRMRSDGRIPQPINLGRIVLWSLDELKQSLRGKQGSCDT